MTGSIATGLAELRPGLAAALQGPLRLGAGAAEARPRQSLAIAALGAGLGGGSVWSNPLRQDRLHRCFITIDAPPERLYDAWRDVRSLAMFVPSVESVEQVGPDRSRWRLRLNSGRTAEWEARITEDRAGESLSWETLGESPFDHWGTLKLAPALGGRGTVVTLELRQRHRSGALGLFRARMRGDDPRFQSAETLRRLKQWIETGEFATNSGPAARETGHTAGAMRPAVHVESEPARPAALPSAEPSRTEHQDDGSTPIVRPR